MGGVNFSIEASVNSQTIPFDGGSVDWAYPISLSSEYIQKAVSAKAEMISGDKTRFLSSVSATVPGLGNIRIATVNFDTDRQ